MHTNKIEKVQNPNGEEALAAKHYWRNVAISSYIHEQPWSRFVAEKVCHLTPNRVFEFGCNAGKNLAAILQVNDTIRCFGIDINENAIAHGMSNNLSVALADENILKFFPNDSFDVSFTVSVLDHLPEPTVTLAELIRISQKAVLLLEPWLGEEGKVVENFNVQKGEVVKTTPFSYSWDYPKMSRQLAPNWSCEVERFSLRTNLGRFYHLYSLIAPA